MECRPLGMSSLVLLVIVSSACAHRQVESTEPFRGKVYITGHASSPREKNALEHISILLKARGYECYLPHRQGLQGYIELFRKQEDIDELMSGNMRTQLDKAVFLPRLYRLLEDSNYLVFNMNGRVPDPGGTFLTGIAFSAGMPLVVYQNDHRRVFHGNNNSMLDGCTWNFSTVSRRSDIPEALDKAIRYHQGIKARGITLDALPPYVRASVETGKEISTYLASLDHDAIAQGLGAIVFLNTIEGIVRNHEACAPPAHELAYLRAAPSPGEHQRKVYCSGGLFSPEELSDMKRISDVLEDNGYLSYLPQRDGLEAFVINYTNNWLANSIFFRPILKRINRQIFALDVYQIIEACDLFVFNMNRCVPDEGGVVELAIALMHGKPIVIFKDDLQGVRFEIGNALLLGASYDFKTIDSVDRLPMELERKGACIEALSKGQTETFLQANVQEVVSSGGRLQQWVEYLQWVKPDNAMSIP